MDRAVRAGPDWSRKKSYAGDDCSPPDHGPVDGGDVADVVGGAQEGGLVVGHPVEVHRLGVGNHGEGAAEDVGGEDDDEESVDYADDGHEVLQAVSGTVEKIGVKRMAGWLRGRMVERLKMVRREDEAREGQRGGESKEMLKHSDLHSPRKQEKQALSG